MTTEMYTTTVRIMNRELKVQCPKDKIKELKESANYLEEKMMDLAANNKSISMERTVVVAALNVVRELMDLKRQEKANLQVITNRLRELKDKIDKEVTE